MLIWLWLLLGPKNVELTVRPISAVIRNESIHVICRIPQRAENRQVAYGLESHLSTREVAGAQRQITFEKVITHISCPGPLVALCALTNNKGKTERRQQTIEVLGCDF